MPQQLSPERSAARALVSRLTPAEAVAGKAAWLLVTVPEVPVAGEDLVVYFNKNQSDVLRCAGGEGGQGSGLDVGLGLGSTRTRATC